MEPRSWEEHLASLPDPELVRLARQPCLEQAAALEYLIRKYRPLVEAHARRFFLVDGDRGDLVQEGLIGLYQAVEAFDPAVPGTFARLADTCVRRRLISAVRRATAGSRQPAAGPVSLDQPPGPAADAGLALAERLPDPRSPDPSSTAVNRERVEVLLRLLRTQTSELEWDCLMRALRGYGATDIATRLQRHPKTVANALYRVRRKARALLSPGNSPA